MPADPEPTLAPGEYFVLGGDEPDTRRASFRLMGERLDPDAITRATGLVPHHAHRKGEARPRSRTTELPPWRSGRWSLDSSNALETSGNHLEDRVTRLLDQLEPVADAVIRLCAEHGLKADFFCGYFMGQSNSGFELSARTLERIAALGATLGIDIYSPPPGVSDRTVIVDDNRTTRGD